MTQVERESAIDRETEPLEHSSSARSTPLERAIVRRMIKKAGVTGLAVRLWDGTIVSPKAESTRYVITLRSRRALLGILADPGMQIGDRYVEGDLTVSGDLVRLLTELNAKASDAPAARDIGTHKLKQFLLGASKTRSRQSAVHHYNLGTDFYRLWLDESLTYTCAYFEDGADTLEQAQYAKNELICRKLDLRPGERVVEAGSGWGTLALHMASKYGVSVRSFNIAPDQVRYARDCANAAGLSELVDFVEGDYREIAEHCDAFVSVGMLEHVGPRQYAGFGRVIDRCLDQNGRGLIHTIGRHRWMPPNRWMQRRIFPDGYVPSLRESLDVFESNRLAIVDLENLRIHYKKTIEHWLERFDQAAGRIEEMSNERFVRTWRLYLASCIASFDAGWHQLYQFVFTRPGSNRLPDTRNHLYRHNRPD